MEQNEMILRPKNSIVGVDLGSNDVMLRSPH